MRLGDSFHERGGPLLNTSQNPDEAVALGDYTTVDLMAAYTTGRHKIQANAYNILDEKYILGATNGTSGLNQIGYGAPAEFMLSYGYQF